MILCINVVNNPNSTMLKCTWCPNTKIGIYSKNEGSEPKGVQNILSSSGRVLIYPNPARGAENILDTFLVQDPHFYYI